MIHILNIGLIMCHNSQYLLLELWSGWPEDSRFHVQLLPPAVERCFASQHSVSEVAGKSEKNRGSMLTC